MSDKDLLAVLALDAARREMERERAEKVLRAVVDEMRLLGFQESADARVAFARSAKLVEDAIEKIKGEDE